MSGDEDPEHIRLVPRRRNVILFASGMTIVMLAIGAALIVAVALGGRAC